MILRELLHEANSLALEALGTGARATAAGLATMAGARLLARVVLR